MILQNYSTESGSTPTLVKQSSLAEIYRRYSAHCNDINGWNVAAHFGNAEKEKSNLESGSLLADWPHIGKITIRGKEAQKELTKINQDAAGLAPLNTISDQNQAILRLTGDEFLILTKPGEEAGVIDLLDQEKVSVLNSGGGMACLVLAGRNRDAVIERSSAMNLDRDVVPDGSVVQTTIHTIHCTLYRTKDYDIFLHTREYSVSLFEALLDVGMGVGLLPSGLEAVPVNFNSGDN